MAYIRFYLTIAVSLLSSLTFCMENQLSLAPAAPILTIPSELLERIAYEITALDAKEFSRSVQEVKKTIIEEFIKDIGEDTYKQQTRAQQKFIRNEIEKKTIKKIKNKRRDTKHAILKDSYASYYSFSPSFQNLCKAFPSIGLKFNNSPNNPLFLPQLRICFFNQLHISPSKKFIDGFLQRFTSIDPQQMHYEKIHNAFYTLIMTSNFKNTDDLDFLARLGNVPLGITIASLKYPQIKSKVSGYKNLSPQTKSLITSVDLRMNLATFLYNPYVNLETKIRDLGFMSLHLTQEQQLRFENLKAQFVNPNRRCHTKDKNLCSIINYMFSEALAERLSWLKPGRRLILFYYILNRLYFPEGKKNRVIENPFGFLKHQIEELFKIKEYEITEQQFIEYNELLTTLQASPLVPKSSLLRSIFKTHEPSNTLTVFTYYEDYWKAIELHMKDLKDDGLLFFFENFNVLVKHAPDFEKIYQKDFKKLVSDLNI